MKTNWMLFLVLTSGIATGAFAQDSNTSRSCNQQNAKFLQVANDYSSCNSIIGADQEACSRFCDDTDKMLRGGYGAPQGNSCSPEQIQQIQYQARAEGINQGRQQGRDEVMRDLSIREDFLSGDFFGINENDCGRRAAANSQRLRLEAISRCNNKAASIKNCYIQSEKVTGTFGRPPQFEAKSNFRKEDNRSTEDECRKTALSDATREALGRCLTATGHECTINQSQTILTYRIQQPSGPRFGRRDSRVCDARVVAEAPRDLTYKCNVRISARNQATAN